MVKKDEEKEEKSKAEAEKPIIKVVEKPKRRRVLAIHGIDRATIKANLRKHFGRLKK